MSGEHYRGGESKRRAVSLTAIGLLTITSTGELARSAAARADIKPRDMAAEVRADRDPMSAEIDKNLENVYARIRILAGQHVKNTHHALQKDASGTVFDRYVFASPVSKLKPSAGYIQLVCIALKGSNLPEGCEVLFGVPKPLAPAQPYIAGSFFVKGGPDQYSLENILPEPSGRFTEDYFNMDRGGYSHKFRMGQGPWHTEKVSKDRVQTPYDHFFHNAMVVLGPSSTHKQPAA